MRALSIAAVALVALVGAGTLRTSAQEAAAPAGAMQMPDAKQMSGMPLPSGETPQGTVVVRVLRGSLANPLAKQPVELIVAGASRTATTNDAGRAEFAGLAAGTMVKAVTTVAGERLESQEFTIPPTNGIRLMLVATDPEAAKRAAEDQKLAQGPAQPGTVVLGSESRFVFEMGDEGLSVFNILQIVNTGRVPVQTPEPLVFDLPEVAENAAILEGSSPQATVAGRRVTVVGPFAPGPTLVQFAYTMPYSSETLTVEQRLPAALTQLTVLAQKVGDLHLTSPQMAQHRDMTTEGQTYILGQGPALKAGDSVTFNFTGLPHATTWPRNVALALALVLLVGGAWGSMRSGAATATADARRRKLEAKRDRLFAELTEIEQQHLQGGLEPRRYATRRRELVSALEGVYAEMDEEAAA